MLDEHEQRALEEFLRVLEEEHLTPKPLVDKKEIYRGPDGQIIVPVVLKANEPSLSLALFMAHKAEQVCKQTGCRFLICQRLDKDKNNQRYIWANDTWQPLH